MSTTTIASETNWNAFEDGTWPEPGRHLIVTNDFDTVNENGEVRNIMLADGVFNSRGMPTAYATNTRLLEGLTHWRYALPNIAAEPRYSDFEKVPELLPIENVTDYMTYDKYTEQRAAGMLLESQGFGYYATSLGRSNVLASTPRPKWATHIVWHDNKQ